MKLENENKIVKRIINEIRVDRSYVPEKQRAFLIIEGDTDARAYGRFIREEKCRMMIAEGKDNALRVLEISEQENFDGVLIITDANSMLIEGKKPSSPNHLITDYHDMEMMIFRSPAPKKLLIEYGSEKKIRDFIHAAQKSVCAVLLECALPIGFLRWISLCEDLALKFEDATYEKFVDRERLTIDIRSLIRHVQSRTAGKPRLTDEKIAEKLQQLMNQAYDPWHVCCGHDMTAILALGLRKALGTNNSVHPEDVEKWLRMSYEHLYFTPTQLSRTMEAWVRKNNRFPILHDFSLLGESEY